MRKRLIAGNWKMNFTGQEAARYLDSLVPSLPDLRQSDVLIIPPFTGLFQVAERIKGTDILLGAQNLFPEPKGAFTGEISPEMLKESGCRFVLAGHSERRHLMGETDELVNRKILSGLESGLNVIFCVGETAQQREEGIMEKILNSQLERGLAGFQVEGASELVVAYEPVWAIGTGVTATSNQAQEAHRHIRSWIDKNIGASISERLRILYGGSVTPHNAGTLLEEPDIDGLLIGSASLDPEKFCAIISTAQ